MTDIRGPASQHNEAWLKISSTWLMSFAYEISWEAPTILIQISLVCSNYWQEISIGVAEGLVPKGNKPVPAPMTQFNNTYMLPGFSAYIHTFTYI